MDMTGSSESGLCMLLRNTTAVVVITLGFMTFGVWQERDNGNAGAENVADFLKRELIVYQIAIPSQTRDLRYVDINVLHHNVFSIPVISQMTKDGPLQELFQQLFRYRFSPEEAAGGTSMLYVIAF